MRRLHHKTFLELTFHEWNFQKCSFLWAEQSTFSNYGHAAKPFRGFVVVLIAQGRDLSELLILRELSHSQRLELS